jgi:DNA-binding CsgD family transcriptional regulator/tetratricopeptide (TPR) repeat protein
MGAMAAVDSSPVFIARAAELELLDAALARAAAGRPSVVVVGGEAGIGKTRLLEEFGARVRDRAIVLVGRCVPGAADGSPYAPFADLVRDLERQTEPDRLVAILGPARAELGLVVPELGSAVDRVSPDDRVETRAVSRDRLFELLLGIAGRLQEARPAVIAIEDLQWADEATLALLGYIARGIREGRLLLVLTVRTEDLRSDDPVLAAIGDLERTGLVDRIELARFSRPELAAQVSGILGAPADPGLVDWVMGRSDGNPFFAEEVLAAERRGEGADVPQMLDDLLRARLATVSEAARGVLRVAALVGVEIDDELVAVASGLPAADVAVALRQAADRGLLVRSGRAPIRFAFRHRLLQEATERDLLPGERRHLHGAFAEALEQTAPPATAAGEIARHWLLAGRPDRALPAAMTAGIEAERRFAFAEARRHFELALQLSESMPIPAEPPDLDRVALLQRAADVAVLAGDPAAAVDLARRALADLGPGIDPRREAAIHERLRWYLWESGDHEGAEAALEEAYRLVPADPPSATRARVLGQFGGLRLRQGQWAESLALAEEAVDVARASGALAELAFALGVRGCGRTVLGRPTEGIADLRDGLAMAEFLGRPEGRALGIANLSSVLLYAGRLDEAFRTAVDGLATVRSIGLERTYGGSLAATAAAAAYHLGRWGEARELCARALAITAPGPEAVWPGAVAMRLAAGSGDEDLLRSGIAVAQPFLAAAADRIHAEWYWLASIEAELAADRAGRAQEIATAVIGGLPPTVLDEPTGSLYAMAIRIAAERADAARAVGDEDALVTQRAIADRLFVEWRHRRLAFPAPTPDPAAGDAVEALCAAEAGRASGAGDPSGWERAALAHERLGLVHPAAYARFRQAEALLEGAAPHTPRAVREARSAAAAPLRVALGVARDLGARPLARAAEQLARRARLDMALPGDRSEAADTMPAREPTRERGDDRAAAFIEHRHLTPREVEILALVGSGWSNGEIASALYISRKTASVHVSNILGKLGVADRVEAGALAQRAGLVGEPRPGSVLPELDADA